MSLRLLAAEDRISLPWKNGGGVTAEIAASPAGAGIADFDWRISVAQVEAGGPFSSFPGVDRALLVLDGQLNLEIAGSQPLNLDASGPAAEFAGEVTVVAADPARPVTDLNVMVRRGVYTASLERRTIDRARALVCSDVTLVLAPECGLEARLGARVHRLAPGDAALVEGAKGGLLRLRSETPCEVAVVQIHRGSRAPL